MDHGGRGGGSCFTLSEVFDPYELHHFTKNVNWKMNVVVNKVGMLCLGVTFCEYSYDSFDFCVVGKL